MEENKPAALTPDQKETKQQGSFSDLLKTNNNNNNTEDKKPEQQPAADDKEQSSAEKDAGRMKQGSFSDMLKSKEEKKRDKQETIADKKTLEGYFNSVLLLRRHLKKGYLKVVLCNFSLCE